MKKLCVVMVILTLVVFLPFSLASSAEEMTAKGRIELGGNVAFTHSSYEGGSTTDITVMPRLGYFVIPKLELEPTLLVSNTSYSPDGGDSYSGTEFGLVFNVAYHFESASESKLVPFIFAGLGFASFSGDLYPQDAKTSMIVPDAGGGIKYFITNSALIRGEAFWEHVTNESGMKDNDADHFGIRAGVSIFVK
jgi:hypothetical protein